MTPAIISLIAQTEPVVEATDLPSESSNLISLMLGSDVVVQITLITLFVFSIVSWAIIGSKHRQLKQGKERSKRFLQFFWQAKSIDAIVAKGSFRKSPAFNIFKTAVDSVRENQRAGGGKYVEKELRRATEEEIAQMEYGVSFLATTSSASPFIGLFGTVWGILQAFWKIGRTGASSIAIVGPHIAEALIATAAGLAAAIPATIFYNFYVNKIRLLSKDLSYFADDLNEKIHDEYFKSA